MIDTVIFDFDGTLANTGPLIVKSFQNIYKKYYGVEKPEEYILSTFGEPLKVTIEREFQEPYDEVFKAYRKYQDDNFEKEVKLFPGVKETLIELKNRNIKMGVVTARMRESTLFALEMLGILKYFDVVVAVDDTINHKPHPEPLIKAMDMLKTNNKQTLFVGDSRYDMECADNAHTFSALCAWHNGYEDLVNQYNVTYVLNNMFDLIDYI